MPKYEVEWTKTYYASGVVEVEADHKDDAHDMVLDNIGDYEGSMQYDPSGDDVYVIRTKDKDAARAALQQLIDDFKENNNG